MSTALAMVRQRCEEAGFDPAVVTDAHLEAALRRRQRARGSATDLEYGQLLATDRTEQDEILEELLVRESWFYRDDAPFALLSELAATRWQRRADGIRVLSAPCASGEEPYSIAIALAAGGLAPNQFMIEAVDLSRRGLAAARAAVYPARVLAKLPAALQEQWLRPHATGTAIVCDELRQAVRLHHGNLLALPAALCGTPFDVVFCRNALIYLQPRARAQVLDALSALLAPDGVLVVGHAEAGLLRERPMRSLGRTGTFAFERSTSMPATSLPRREPHAAPTTPRVRVPRGPRPATAPVPATAVSSLEAQLAQARALADRGAYAAAAAQVTALLARHMDNADAQHLLGLIRAAEGDTAQAQQCFQRALYLEPAHLPSLEHLALLAARCGDEPQARLLRQRAARLESGT